MQEWGHVECRRAINPYQFSLSYLLVCHMPIPIVHLHQGILWPSHSLQSRAPGYQWTMNHRPLLFLNDAQQPKNGFHHEKQWFYVYCVCAHIHVQVCVPFNIHPYFSWFPWLSAYECLAKTWGRLGWCCTYQNGTEASVQRDRAFLGLVRCTSLSWQVECEKATFAFSTNFISKAFQWRKWDADRFQDVIHRMGDLDHPKQKSPVVGGCQPSQRSQRSQGAKSLEAKIVAPRYTTAPWDPPPLPWEIGSTSR